MTDFPKQQLIDLLDRQLFQPLTDTNPDRFPPFQRAAIDELRAEVANIAQHIHAAESEAEVVRRFDAASTAAADNGLDARLAELDLPTLAEARYHLGFLGGQATVVRS
jgi:hypothetical protein